MNDKMREEFEAAYLAKYDLKPQNWNGVAYLHAHGNGAWWAWQASRAALCVDLEHAHRSIESTPFGGTMYSGEVIKAIESTGVRVK